MRSINIVILLLVFFFSSLFSTEKKYIDSEELDTQSCGIYLHTGQNIWLETRCIHSDKRGLFTFESDIVRLDMNNKGISSFGAYTQQWKCPYCYNYWPIGTACQNAQCPSKYK